MNVILIGYRCSGKTSVAKVLADNTGRKFIDTDELIVERAGQSIEDIVATGGWEHFRALEKEVIKEVSDLDGLVIATGGGVVMDEINVINLRRNGFVVWLNGNASVLRSRMIGDKKTDLQRPSLTGENPMDEIQKMLEIRNPIYQKAGDVEIDTNNISVPEIVDLIVNELMKMG